MALKNKVTILTEDEFTDAIKKAKGDAGSLSNATMDIEPTVNLPAPNSSNALWTTKYAPKSTNDIIGNSSTITSIATWLQNWNRIHLEGGEAPAMKMGRGGFGNASNPGAKACLVTGPPGIGKTTTIRLLTEELGFSLVEKNSSEQRNKACMNATLLNLKDNQVLTLENKSQTLHNRVCILMDEVDGMSSGDRGGIQALIEHIKSTKVPIICVANDRSSPKLKSLANHCYDIRFSRPSKQMIAKRIIQICFNEGMSTDQNTLELICENLGNDLRQILGYLEMKSRMKGGQSLQYKETKERIKDNKKDEAVMINNFEAATKLLNRNEFSKLSVKDRTSLFFIDYDLIPLIFQENYLSSLSRQGSNANDLENLAEAAGSIAESDIVSNTMRRSGEWSLIVNYAFTSTIYPGQMVSQIVPFAKFPE